MTNEELVRLAQEAGMNVELTSRLNEIWVIDGGNLNLTTLANFAALLGKHYAGVARQMNAPAVAGAIEGSLRRQS